MLTKALFFVGYSLSDPDFRLLMDRQLTHFKGFVPERFALMMDVGPVERDVLWRTARIHVSSYDKGQHGQVLEFLQALKAEVLREPAPQAKAPIPPPAAASPQPGKLTSLNMPSALPAQVSIAKMMSPGNATWLREDEGLESPAMEAADDRDEIAARPQSASSPSTRAPVPQPSSARPYVLSLESVVRGRVRFRLHQQGEVLTDQSTPPKLSQELLSLLQQALQESQGTAVPPGLYADFAALFEKHRVSEVLEPLDAPVSSAQAPLVMYVPRRLSHFPWELLPLRGQPLCLQRKLVRMPVGVPPQVRGTPEVRQSPRILLVEGARAAQAEGTREIERLARQYQQAQGVSCTVLQGTEATFARVMAELDTALPDLLHYTGDLGLLGGELVLKLQGGMDLSAGTLRSVLSQGRLPFLVLNAPSSAFVPPTFGLYPGESRYQRQPVPAPGFVFEGRWGFMDLAVELGVGAFVGAFDMPGAQAGTAFMAALHYALLAGFPIADAVLQARREVHKNFPGDPTALQYVLSGDGDLQLVNSQRE
jgi:hypothetical protein